MADKLKYVRVYRCTSGEVVIDCPNMGHQKQWEITGEDRALDPWRFRGDREKTLPGVEEKTTIIPGNPDKEDYVSKEIMPYVELEKLVSGKKECEGGSLQFYYDENDKLCYDENWGNNLMSSGMVQQRHIKRINAFLDEELEKKSPDAIQVAKWQREVEKCKSYSDEKWLEVALNSLQHADVPKPIIEKKLQDKIAELQDDEPKHPTEA